MINENSAFKTVRIIKNHFQEENKNCTVLLRSVMLPVGDDLTTERRIKTGTPEEYMRHGVQSV
jgi:hypothetical protein